MNEKSNVAYLSWTLTLRERPESLVSANLSLIKTWENTIIIMEV